MIRSSVGPAGLRVAGALENPGLDDPDLVGHVGQPGRAAAPTASSTAGERLPVATTVGQGLDLGAQQPRPGLRVVALPRVEQGQPLLGGGQRVEGALGEAGGRGQGSQQLGPAGRVGTRAPRRASRSSSRSSPLRACPGRGGCRRGRSTTLSTSGSVSGISDRAFWKCRQASSGPPTAARSHRRGCSPRRPARAPGGGGVPGQVGPGAQGAVARPGPRRTARAPGPARPAAGRRRRSRRAGRAGRRSRRSRWARGRGARPHRAALRQARRRSAPPRGQQHVADVPARGGGDPHDVLAGRLELVEAHEKQARQVLGQPGRPSTVAATSSSAKNALPSARSTTAHLASGSGWVWTPRTSSRTAASLSGSRSSR